MTKQEGETFLADLHVGIISIPEEGRDAITVLEAAADVRAAATTG
jgi:hypothetical protein